MFSGWKTPGTQNNSFTMNISEDEDLDDRYRELDWCNRDAKTGHLLA